MMCSIKLRDASKAGATRQHTAAITIEDTKTLMTQSEMVCPDSLFCNAPQNLQSLELMNKHALMRAFAATGFTLWTR